MQVICFRRIATENDSKVTKWNPVFSSVDIYLHPSIFNELNIFVGPHSSILEFFDLLPSGQQGLIPNLAIHLQSMEERVSDARKETGLLDSRVMPRWGFEKRYPIAFGVTLFGYFVHSRKQICRGT